MDYYKSVGIILLLATFASQSQSEDFCAVKECKKKKHIACNNNGEFDKNCQKPSVLEVNSELILNTFNTKRNAVAGGTEKFEPAARMATMQWDIDLADLALLNLKTCKSQEDECRKTEAYKNSGQLVTNLRYTPSFEVMSNEELIMNRIEYWMKDEDYIKMTNIYKYEKIWKPNFGSFALIITDRNTHVGCASIRHLTEKTIHLLLTCNFATENIDGREIYKVGKVAEGCTTGTDQTYTNLCSTQEVYLEKNKQKENRNKSKTV